MPHRRLDPPPSDSADGRAQHRPVDPIVTARAIGDILPEAIAQARAAGLLLVARHLGKALDLARRIAAGDPRD